MTHIGQGGMADDWWQAAPGKIAAPPILSWESGAKKCGDLSGIGLYTVIGRDWGRMAALEVSSQESHLASLAGHLFVSLESASQLVSAGVCLCPVSRHLHVSSWPQVIWVGKWSQTFMNGQS